MQKRAINCHRYSLLGNILIKLWYASRYYTFFLWLNKKWLTTQIWWSASSIVITWSHLLMIFNMHHFTQKSPIYILIIETLTKHCISFSGASLTICKYCTIKTLNDIANWGWKKVIDFLLFGFLRKYSVILTFNLMTIISNFNPFSLIIWCVNQDNLYLQISEGIQQFLFLYHFWA